MILENLVNEEDLNPIEEIDDIDFIEEEIEVEVKESVYKVYEEKEYLSLIKEKYSISEDISYDSILEDFVNHSSSRMKHIRTKVNFSRIEIISLVLTYQNQMKNNIQDDLIFYVIYNLFLPMVIRISNRYVGYGIVYKKKSSTQEEDYFQEAFLILLKCMEKFKVYEDKMSSFSSYYQGEITNHFIETTRTKYFEIMKVPSTKYREHRKDVLNSQDNQKPVHFKMKEEMCYTILNSQDDVKVDTEDNIIDSLNSIIEIIDKVGKVKNIKPTDIIILALTSGLCCETYNLNHIAIIFGVSNSFISKRNKELKARLSADTELRDFLKQSLMK